MSSKQRQFSENRVLPKNFFRRGAPVRGTDISSITISSVHSSKTDPPVLYFYKVNASSLLRFLKIL